MPAPLSIIIPCLNAAPDLPACLEGLMPGLEAGLIREVIIVDGGSSDASRNIAGATGARLVEMEGGRGARLGAGAASARGDWFLFLDPATVLSRDWAERAAAHMGLRRRKAAMFRLRYRSDARRARRQEAWSARLTRWSGLPLGHQGLLISRRLYEETGGFADVGSDEDWLLAQAIGRRRLVVLDAEARVPHEALAQAGWRQTLRLLQFLMRGGASSVPGHDPLPHQSGSAKSAP